MGLRSDIGLIGSDGGFILAPGCALPCDTPGENTTALVESAIAVS